MSDVRSGMVIAGKYRIEAVIARGGMGSVWRARHLTLETPLAVKFIGADVSALQEARRRFEREAKAAAVLQSPHVVQIHDYGVEGDVPYLVMELLEGEDLGARLKKRERLGLAETASIVVQVARALRRAAEATIVHRDLKPSNVFLVRAEEEEELVKVLDFGIAKAPRTLRPDDDSTKAGAIIGSPRYMSPEQARGSPLVDPRSDLWSLAVIAYRALTGELPFQSTDLEDLIVKICRESPPPPSRLVPELGPDIDAFFARALDRDPAGRFQTARELAAAFVIATGEAPPSLSSFRLQGRTISGELPVAVLVPPAPPSARAPASASSPAPAPVPAPTSVPDHETTRVSGEPAKTDPATMPDPAPEPAAARQPELRSKDTPTPYPSGVDLPHARTPRPPRAPLVRPLAIGAGAGALITVAVFLALSPWRRPPVAVAPAAAPSPTVVQAAAAPSIAPPAPPVATTAPHTATSATSSTTSAAPEAPPPPRSPGRRVMTKKNSILGI